MLTARTSSSAVRHASRRLFATEAPSSAIKVAALENPSPSASVTLVVKAGSRYETTPGAAHVLKNFAFKGTSKRSALRTVRESELYGGVLSATLGREHLALTAEFLKGDEYYFVDVLTGVLTSSTYAPHELHESVAPQVEAESAAASADPAALALDAAHAIAFRNGLGNPIFATSGVALDAVKDYAKKVFTVGNVAVIASGVEESVVKKLVESKLAGLPSSSSSSPSSTKYFGGESRVASHSGPSTLFIGFGTTTPASAPALSVLGAYLDPTPSLKWTEGTSPLSSLAASGVSAQVVNETYSDGSLFGVVLQSGDSAALSEAGKTVVATLKGVSGALKEKEAFGKALAKAKLNAVSALESGREAAGAALASQLFSQGALDVKAFESVQAADVSKAAEALTKGKATYVAVGNVATLPYGDELGL
ncbi:LuxS MPP-like metallohydrolase [Clavulina sp. PMI_390]|nr:LuxS MPP-like metallohydrolase [Clavulina sp. PMI_390]